MNREQIPVSEYALLAQQLTAEKFDADALIHDGRLWHLFFTHNIAGGEWARDDNLVDIGHATSADLLAWKLLEPALTTGPKGGRDAAHVYAPYVIRDEGRYYMFYAGTAVHFWTGAHMMLATSEDLVHWTRHEKTLILAPDPSWSLYYAAGYKGGLGGPAACRDPFILPHPEHGFILHYAGTLSGDDARPSTDNEYSCVAAATSRDLVNWRDRGPVLVRRRWCYDTDKYSRPESPRAIRREYRYYLFWKGGSGIRYVISDNPFDFRDREAYFLATSHASAIFRWGERWFITSCGWDPGDLNRHHNSRTKGLFLARLEWDGIWPRVRAIENHPGHQEHAGRPDRSEV